MSHDMQVDHGLSPVRTPPSPWTLEGGLHEVAMRTLDLARADGQIQRKCEGGMIDLLRLPVTR
ncbi:MAG: hypothetical protein AW06_003444 [Candidatus Accumulibacter cognatus]|uniref:Uncharacterized protein n=1 Tax=Candidatus Accumulibacter cognatus TaxID=2954383 RepID=A0A080ME84_9PROT|nr:MAG: hypothetical protein AW06_003444 [Candidatus Accumulibacter cognatus]